ncbi:MAG: glutamyl-tRNA reductase [Candidatus Latescibacterota bacterium]
MATIALLGISHKTAPVDVRERFAIAETDLPKALQTLRFTPGVEECLILSTCNRLEVYGVLADSAPDPLESFLRDYHGCPGDLDPYLYALSGELVFRHLCRVSAGLDSLVIGEPQIFGQVKEAYRRAGECGCTGPVLQSLFPQSFSVVKKVRAVTGIGRSNVSVSYTAVDLARRIFPHLEGVRVMLVGVGEMGTQTARALLSHGAREVLVTNRTFQRAAELAVAVGGSPIMFYEIPEYLPKTDILISSVAATAYVVTAEQVQQTLAARGERPLFAIDISVPRSIEPAVGGLPGVSLYNIDDLVAVVESNAGTRRQEAERASRIIDERAAQVMAKLTSAALLPSIVSLKESAEQIRQQGVHAMVSRLQLSEAGRQEVDACTRSMTNRIVYHALTALRELVNKNGAQ